MMGERPLTITFQDPAVPPPPPMGAPPPGQFGSPGQFPPPPGPHPDDFNRAGGGGDQATIQQLLEKLELERHDNGEAVAHIVDLENRLGSTEQRLVDAESALQVIQ